MTATLQPQTVNAAGQQRPPTPYGAPPPQDYPRTPPWTKIALGALALVVSAAVGAVTAAVVVAGSITSGTPTSAPAPSASAVHAANVKLCTLYYSAMDAFGNWDATLPSREQKNGTSGASVYLVTGNFLQWALTQTTDADFNLRENIGAVAQANIDSAGVYSGKPEGLIQPPTIVPDTAYNNPDQKIHDFCIKGS